MQINALCDRKIRVYTLFRLSTQTLRVMRLTAILLLCAGLTVSARTVSQTITFSAKNVALEKVFSAIKQQTGYLVLYSVDVIEQTSPVTITAKDESLTSFLSRLLSDQPLSYLIENKTISIQRKVAGVLSPVQDNSQPLLPPASVTGTVRGPDGRPLAGVNVIIKGSKTGTTTGADGKFSLNANTGVTLVISSIGYSTKEVKARPDLGDIQLEIVNARLEDMVVVGYGSTKRKDLTGSVASVNVNEIKDIPYTSIDQALSGKAAGVQVVQSDGSPGGVASIRVRGGTSIMGGNDPLYIIDGVQVTPQDRYLKTPGEVVDPVARSSSDDPSAISGSFSRGLNSLAGLNINDIESIDILKDASGTAIYGSKAANGVIIITTKKGKYNQKPFFEFNNYTGSSVPIKAKLLNADQYRMIMKEAATNLNTDLVNMGQSTDATADNILNNPAYLGTANTDWLKLVLRNGLTQNTDISVRGGGKASSYYTSLSYTNQTGVVKGTDFSRLSGKINLDNEVTSRLRFTNNIDFGFTTTDITNGAYSQALYAPPTRAPYNADGTIANLNGSALGGSDYSGFQNPLTLLNGINKGKNASFLGSMALEYEIIKGLKFRSQASINYNMYHQRNYTPSSALLDAGSYGAADSQGGVGSQGQTESVTYLYENMLSYIRQLDKNNRIDVVGGTSWELNKTSSFQASGQTYPDDFVLNNLGSAAVTLPNISSTYQNSLLSFYMRANYAYQDKYLLTVTGRSDASSKFASNNQVGVFPSAGIAWRASQENFLKKVTWIDDLKIRASAGYTGTQNIGNYLYRTLNSPAAYGGANALIPTQLGNDKIKWESTLQKDAGVDFSLFKSRIVASIGIYEKKSSGLLFTEPLPPSSSYSTLTANLADIRNRGLEIDVQGEIFRGRGFSWKSDINISFNKSLVTNLNSDYADPNHGSVEAAGGTSYIFSNTVLRTGYPVGQFVGSQFEGIINTPKQLSDYQASYPYYFFFYPYLNIGDPMYLIPTTGNLAGFPDTYRLIGAAAPKFFGGFTNTFSYGNFSLSTLFNFSYGGHILYLADIQNKYVADLTNKGTRILQRWTPENTNSQRPRLIYGQNAIGTASDDVYSSSYIKLKSVSLNYRLPRAFLDKVKVQSASLYVSATNLFTITKYPGQDPEVSNDPYSIIDGYTDSNTYPTIRQYVFGLRLGF